MLLRPCRDPKVPATPASSGNGVRERGVRYVLNPADRSALEFALEVAREKEMNVVAICYNTISADDLLYEAQAMGADKAILLQGFSPDNGDTTVEGKILARLTHLLDCGLVCTGTRLLDRGAALGPAVAASLSDLCCVHSVVQAEIGEQSAKVVKKSDRGGRQEVAVPLPAYLLFEETEGSAYPGVDVILDTQNKTIETWTLSDLGMSLLHSSAFLAYTQRVSISHSRPRPVTVATPDPDLPAFERILSLLEGGIKTREGKLRFLSAKDTADNLLKTVQAKP